jgi:CHAD domain-containing protein
MTPTYDETETKYTVADDFTLPSVPELLGGFGDVVDVELGGTQELALEATYFDTADLSLFHAGLTLRRRTGGNDDGWHLKVPIGDGVRREVRAPLGRSSSTVPIRLRRLVWIATRDRPLVPILDLKTARTELHLVAGDQPLADLADDRVTATSLLGEATNTVTWREIEVELTGGDRPFLKRVGRQLRSFGAERSDTSSKLAHGLGLDPEGALRRKALKRQRKGLSPKSGAGEVLVAYLDRELARLREQDVAVRLDRPDSLHTMRVATRRMRSGLEIFADLFEAGRIEPLETELKWLADELGAARDAEVLRARLLESVRTEQARHLSSRRAAQTVDREMARQHRAAFAGVVAALDSERYQLLVAALEELLEQPPLTANGLRSARKELRRPVARAYADVRKAVLGAQGLPSGDERDEQLHKARKRAKRARYAAEAVTPAFGPEAKAFAAAMEQLQTVLGERHDSVAMQARLHELAQDAAPGAAFTYGRLHARESAHQDAVDASIGRAWKAAARPSLRNWLS